jgi:hypothetical protein
MELLSASEFCFFQPAYQNWFEFLGGQWTTLSGFLFQLALLDELLYTPYKSQAFNPGEIAFSVILAKWILIMNRQEQDIMRKEHFSLDLHFS